VAHDHSLDEIDQIVAFWRTENPALDVTTKQLALRLRRGAQVLERAMRQDLAATGVDEFWEIEVLLSLKRAPGHRRCAGELMREAHVTSGAITNRISRLEQRGWVRRDVDPEDRRQVLVSLTPEGVTRADRVIATKNQTEQRVFGGVDRELLERLNNDLRTLVASMETHDNGPVAPT
jgi:DNA-binding MarR family transcriptional regulator